MKIGMDNTNVINMKTMYFGYDNGLKCFKPKRKVDTI